MNSIASAPAKAILFGEHFVVYGYDAILCAIDKRVAVKTSPLPDPKLSINSQLGRFDLKINDIDNFEITDRNGDNKKDVGYESLPETFKPIVYIVNTILKKHTKHSENTGLRINIESDIPIGVGLGSSSATYIATAASVSNLFSIPTKQEVLDNAIKAEMQIFQNVSGADAAVSLEGGMISYNKKIGYKKMDSHSDFQLLIIDSKSSHSTKSIVDNVLSFKQNNENEFESLLKEEMDIVEKAKKSIFQKDKVSIGKLMLQNHSILKRIGVSNESLDEIVELVKQSCYGAKLTGAGGGGCVIALVDDYNCEKTMERLRQNNFEDYFVSKIDNSGLATHTKSDSDSNKEIVAKEDTKATKINGINEQTP